MVDPHYFDAARAEVLADLAAERMYVQEVMFEIAGHIDDLEAQWTTSPGLAKDTQAGVEHLLRRAREVRSTAHALEGMYRDLDALGLEPLVFESVSGSDDQKRSALPALIYWLPRVDSFEAKGVIVSALGNKWAKPEAAPVLLQEFRSIDPLADPDPGSLRWSVAQSLLHVVGDAQFTPILDLALAPESGDAREFLILALGRMRRHRAELVPSMLGWLRSNDEAVNLPAAKVLADWKVAEAAPIIESLIVMRSRDIENHIAAADKLRAQRTELSKALRRIPSEAQPAPGD
jgi:hypothetical protein